MTDDTPTASSDCRIDEGDCIDEMQSMDANSVHAVVTDPPYGMAFMPEVNEWDEFDSPMAYQEWCDEWAREALRVLKPGGHLIAFSGTRTYGFLMCGVHSAGFEIRDTITWHYGTGFGAGKTQDVANWMDDEENAEKWSGFKMGLKPATELAVLARKPFDGATYANILENGTGALNVDDARVPAEEGGRPKRSDNTGDAYQTTTFNGGTVSNGSYADGSTTEGRYPANLCIDPTAAAMLDEQSGTLESGDPGDSTRNADYAWTSEENNTDLTGYGDSGDASRFFYCAKASPNERSINEQVENDHSTVKPLELMEWLVTLVTAPGQRILDPFAGSGTTIMACKRLGREGLGIEMDDEHAEVARKRVELAHEVETDFNTTEPGSEDADDTDEPATLESFGDDD